MPPARIYEGGAEWPSYSTATAICSRGRTALVLKQHRNIGSILHLTKALIQGRRLGTDLHANLRVQACLFVT